jgi:hypothetical protein
MGWVRGSDSPRQHRGAQLIADPCAPARATRVELVLALKGTTPKDTLLHKDWP